MRGTSTSPPITLAARPVAITAVRWRSSARESRTRCSRTWKLSDASPVASSADSANSAHGEGWKRCVAITITGQCQRYVPYDTRPRYTALGAERARVTPTVRDASTATISAALTNVAARPR